MKKWNFTHFPYKNIFSENHQAQFTEKFNDGVKIMLRQNHRKYFLFQMVCFQTAKRHAEVT